LDDITSSDVESKFQAASVAYSTLYDRFCVPGNSLSSLAGNTVTHSASSSSSLQLQAPMSVAAAEDEVMCTHKLYAHDADMSSLVTLDRDVKAAVEHLAQTLTLRELVEESNGMAERAEYARESWVQWRSLLSLLSELAVCAYSIHIRTFFV
jgi:hypothetical protein